MIKKFKSNKKGKKRIKEYNKWRYDCNINNYRVTQLLKCKLRSNKNQSLRKIPPEKLLEIVGYYNSKN